jgi:FixJ family two-component response regulator
MMEAGVVAVVDDDAAARTSLLRLLGVAGYVTRGYDSAAGLLQDGVPVACIVTDLQMPGMTGLELQRALRERGREVPLVFVTGFGTVPVGVQAMREGAVDFLEKPADPGALLEAVARAVARGGAAMARRAQRDEVAGRLALLTPREREVFDAVVQGWPNKQVAAQLGIALKTVKVHRGRVMQKMEAASVADLVRASELLAG